MKELSVAGMRDCQIKLLNRFDEVCRQQGFRYFLSGGTLLGAVRHRGYIPWDDDIDVMMPRPDYEQMLKSRDAFNEDDYLLFSPYGKEITSYPYTYAKYYDCSTELIEMPETKHIKSHIYIDIFPIDGLPADEEECDKYFKQIGTLKKLHRFFSIAKYNCNYGSIVRKTAWRMVAFLANNSVIHMIQKRLDAKLQKIDYDAADYVAVIVAGYGKREKTSKLAYEQQLIMFEGKPYSGIRGYDEYLTNLYGDYMQLPPKEKQIRTHDYIAYRK